MQSGFRLKMTNKFRQCMADDESFTPTGMLAGSMAFITLLIPVTIVLFSG